MCHSVASKREIICSQLQSKCQHVQCSGHDRILPLQVSSLRKMDSGQHKIKIDTLMVATGVSAKWVEQMNRVSAR